MKRDLPTTAVYTTVHPGTLPYLREWHASILRQTRQEFDLWVGVDQVRSDALSRATDKPLGARFIESQPGDTPARLRERAIKSLIDRYEVVVFVDSDDVAANDRVQRSLAAIADADVACCSLDLINAAGRSIGGRLTVPDVAEEGVRPIQDAWLLQGNIVGLGNSTFRTNCLCECLPIPPDCVAVDWLLATRAWLHDARMVFDPRSGGFYRRHAGCVVPIRPPFTVAAILAATEIVAAHYASVGRPAAVYRPDRKRAWDARHADVEGFAKAIHASSETADEYVCALNSLPVAHTWWSCVAHPALESIWRKA